MDPIIAAAAISAGANLLGGALDSFSSGRSNRKLAAYQNQWNLEQWHRENEYNSPKNQVARLRDAGINPRSNGTVQSNQSTNSPSAAEYSIPPTPFSYMGSSVEKLTDTLMQYKKIESDIEVNESVKRKNNATALREMADSNLLTDERDRRKAKHFWEKVEKEHQFHLDGINFTRGGENSLGSYSFEPTTFGLNEATIRNRERAIFYDNELRKLDKAYKEDQQRFRNTTGFNSPKEALPFLIRLAELIFK